MTEKPYIWAALPIPAILVDAEDRIWDINPEAESFLNASSKSMRGVPVWDKITVDAPMEDALLRARTHGTPLFVNDADIGTGDGPPIQGNLQIAPLVDAPGQMLILITSRELAGRLTRSQGGKSSVKSAIGMAEMMAHEIKNPLAGITGAAQLLSMNLPPEDLELTDLIVEESRRIVKLLEQVEQFGNLSKPQKQAVNLHDVLDRARRSAAVGFGAHMTIVEDYDPSLPLAQGDADQLLQVMLNLVKNASEASDKKGKIRLKTFYDHSFRMRRLDGTGQPLPLQIEIKDDGPGLPQDIKGDVFDPFVSGRENGTGLGLALVSKIISDHDGLITVDSVPGNTVFRISLPRLPKKAEANLKETR